MKKNLVYILNQFFFEIKRKFPNISLGDEESLKLNVEKQQEKNNQNNNTIIPDLISYREQLKKLIKKFIFFFDVFKEKKKYK